VIKITGKVEIRSRLKMLYAMVEDDFGLVAKDDFSATPLGAKGM
jgi:hypothetical protein